MIFQRFFIVFSVFQNFIFQLAQPYVYTNVNDTFLISRLRFVGDCFIVIFADWSKCHREKRKVSPMLIHTVVNLTTSVSIFTKRWLSESVKSKNCEKLIVHRDISNWLYNWTMTHTDQYRVLLPSLTPFNNTLIRNYYFKCKNMVLSDLLSDITI